MKVTEWDARFEVAWDGAKSIIEAGEQPKPAIWGFRGDKWVYGALVRSFNGVKEKHQVLTAGFSTAIVLECDRLMYVQDIWVRSYPTADEADTAVAIRHGLSEDPLAKDALMAIDYDGELFTLTIQEYHLDDGGQVVWDDKSQHKFGLEKDVPSQFESWMLPMIKYACEADSSVLPVPKKVMLDDLTASGYEFVLREDLDG